ncbi:MAG: WxcM-like domain-containing protein [bacterium]
MFKLQQLDRTYIKGLFTLGFARALNNAAPVVLMIYFARSTSDESLLGKISVILAIIAVLTLLSDYGLSTVVQKFLAVFPAKQIISSLLFIQLFINFSIGIVIVFFSLNRDLGSYSILLLIIGLASIFNILVMSYNGLMRQSMAALFYFLSAFLFLLFAFFLNQIHVNAILSLIYGRLISWIILDLIMLWDLHRAQLLTWRYKLSRRVVYFTLNTFTFAMAELVVGHLDISLIYLLLGSESAGNYSPIAFLGKVPSIFAIFIGSPLLPILAQKLKQENEQTVSRFILKITALISSFSLIYFLIVCLFTKVILHVITPTHTSLLDQRIFILNTLAEIFFAIGITLFNYFLAYEKSNIVRNIALLRLVIFGSTAVYLVKIYGLIGISYALLLCYLISLILYAYYFWRRYQENSRFGLEKFNYQQLVTLKLNQNQDGILVSPETAMHSSAGDINAKYFFYVTTKQHNFRGNHYHKFTKQWLIVLASQVEFFVEDIETKTQAKYLITAEKPEILVLEPYHAIKFRNVGQEKMLLFVLCDKVRDPIKPDTFPYFIK